MSGAPSIVDDRVLDKIEKPTILLDARKARQNIVAMADKALYRAKEEGRNRFVFWTP